MSGRKHSKTERTVMRLNQEIFDVAVGMQMVMLEASARVARDVASFAARRARATARDVTRLTRATTPREVVGAHLDRMNDIVRDYSRETGRLIGIAGRATHEGAEGLQAASLVESDSKPN